ncbi:L-seryl-tRNA(Sec) selenium transferase [Actinospongicola halichondriae]|uniref:L-seryl-tRNA(Sec) selenium transferase n=1 Tax=Actinospongicola halichondriae TaxID=3236844 RepID=UPI003D3F101D
MTTTDDVPPADRPPSVDRLARSLADTGLPHPLLVDAAREAIAAGDADSARTIAESISRALLRPVVNATGVLLHTNLGRAPLATKTPGRATNLEFDLSAGERGSRTVHAGGMLARAVGAEDAIVVNNCAAAVMLALAALAQGRGAAVSRGELVEIGGGFRVPDVMAQSGARLVEVGTTNRTRVGDYDAVIDDDLALVLKVHRSNYTISGFTEETPVAELAALPVPVVVDLGSGLLDAACPWLDDGPPAWLLDEPAAKQTLAEGADLVLFSGDKLLGGPQAGIIAGRSDLVRACAKHPLYRAFRPGGLVLAALQDVATAYLSRTADQLPFWRMATTPVETLRQRAEALVDEVGEGAVTDCASVPGGGTLPSVEIPSIGVAFDGDHVAALRSHRTPVIARVVDGRTILDLRTVEPDDDPFVAAALTSR